MTDHSRAEATEARRLHYRPPVGIPIERERNRVGVVASFLLHAALAVLLVWSTRPPPVEILFPNFDASAGDPNQPAGGGGGGTRGTGGIPAASERLQYAEMRPQPAPVPTPAEVKAEEIKPDPVVEVKPPVVEPPVMDIVTPVVQTTIVATIPNLGSIDSTLRGRGGGTGNDGTSGSGSGTGGGIGTGDGTGRGSGTGPGTGGGAGTVYPPTLVAMGFIPPPPARLRPLELVVELDVDSTGAVLRYRWNETSDRAYNRRIEDVIRDFRFTPATDGNGRRVQASTKVTFSAGGGS